MGLGDQIRQLEAARLDNNGCGVNKLRKSLPKKDAEEFMSYVNNLDIMASILEKACRAEGYDISAHTINRHRKLQCLCGKVTNGSVK